ncbi:ADP-ribosyltransferase [Nocardia alni]|uniref:ADP-ribosyltransferase n=1 Tax=Nocardia alni TaxID=2815723 RepID=UPI001C219E3E|nr:ADP-ribosyltransferase [Nocardia alni]
MPDGSDALILVGAQGEVHRLPTTGSFEATRTVPPDGRPYFTIRHPDGTTEDIDRELARGFRFRPGADGRPGTLRWNMPEGGIRFLGSDDAGQTGTIDVPHGATLVARPGESAKRWIKLPGNTTWGAVEAPHSVLPELPTLVTRHDTPLFGPSGLPRPQEARQGLADSCSLVAAMKHLAENDPASITEAMADHGDGTVSVRFMIDNTPEWVRVEKSIYVAPGTDQGQFVGHSPGEPLWASMIDKAYAVRFGGGNGYHGTGGEHAGKTAGLLGKGFVQADAQAIQQPIRTVDTPYLLNPLRFDADTLHAVVSAALPDGHPADRAFSDAFAETMDDWERGLEQLYHSTWTRLNAEHPNDTATRDAKWNEFLETEHLVSAQGFHSYLNDRHPGQWQAEKNALAEYYREAHLGQPQDRLLPDRYRAGAELLATQIDYALRRNTTVLLSSDRFSDVRSVAGLIDNHTYAVLGVEYDSATGKPARLLLENPWDDHDGYPVPRPGIEYRLMPARGDFVIDRTDERGRFVRTADGTEYLTDPDGGQHRRDPKPYRGAPGRRAVYGVTPTGERYYQAPDGTEHRAYPDGTTTLSTPEGAEYKTTSDGNSFGRRRGATEWSPLADPLDLWAPVPPRGGLVAVDLAHLPKFKTLGMSGPGTRGLYGPEDPAQARTLPGVPRPGTRNSTPTGLRPAESPATTETPEAASAFEPGDEDTYFGDNLLDLLQRSEAPDGVTEVPRWRVDPAGLEPPVLRPDELLGTLTEATREQLLPVLGVPLEVPRATAPDGSNRLTLVDDNGQVTPLPGVSSVRATYRPGTPGQPAGYKFMQNGYSRFVRTELTDGFVFKPDTPGGDSGELSWNLPEGGLRFLGVDSAGAMTASHAALGETLAAKAGPWPRRFVKFRGQDTWFRVDIPATVLPKLPTLVDRRKDPLFGPDGLPKSQDARQGAAGDCALLAHLKARAISDPDSIVEMMQDNRDGTVSVRFAIQDAGQQTARFEWVRVTKEIYVTRGSGVGHFVTHRPGDPLWASMIEKAFVKRFGKGNGYAALVGGAHLGYVAKFFDKGFYQADPDAPQQPVRSLSALDILNPLGFDVDTLHDLLRDHVQDRNHEVGLEFARAIADTYRKAYREAQDLNADYFSPQGFRNYLDKQFPGAWETEKDALTRYFREVYDGKAENLLLTDRSTVAARAVGYQIDYALRRGTKVTIGTRMLGKTREDSSAVPGLVGTHAYTVLGIERDGAGNPARILLENPHDEAGEYPAPVAGITYRLDPGGTDYFPRDDGGSYRREPNDTSWSIEYGTDSAGARYLRYADGIEYRITGTGQRYREEGDGTLYRVDPDDTRYRRDANGIEYLTDPDGAKRRRAPGGDWQPDPNRRDPVRDMTIPPRGLVVAVDLAHLPKFGALGMSGPGAYGLYSADHPQPENEGNLAATPAHSTLADDSPDYVDQAVSLLDGTEDDVLHGLFDEPDPRTPTNWQPVDDPRDPLLAALAKAWNRPDAAHIRARGVAFLDRRQKDENRRRAIADGRRDRIDAAQWQRELRRQREFDHLQTRYRQLLRPQDPATDRTGKPGDDALLLRLAAEAVGQNAVDISPNGHRSEFIGNPDKPLVFVRRASDGRYEVGLTPTGGLFMASRGNRRMPDYLSSALARLPREEIPPPWDRMLASPQTPLLAGAAMRKRYIGDDAPIAVRSSTDSVPNARKTGRQAGATPVRHMDAEELEGHRVFIGSDGRLYRAADGRLFDTRQVTSSRMDGDGLAMFVMDEFGNMYAADQEGDGLHHTSFLGGRTVTAAGEIEVRDGVLVTMTDRSGHYMPRPEVNDYALDWLRRLGLTVSGSFVRRGFDGRPRDRFGESDRQRVEITHRQILLDAENAALLRKEQARNESGTPDPAVRTRRDNLALRQARLDQWRARLADDIIDKELQGEIFAHPAPSDPLDRLIPPESPRGLDLKSSVQDRTTWWREHGSDWWAALQFRDLAPAYQLGLLTDHPWLRNGEGIPAAVRNTLNRKYLQLEIARLAALGDPDTLLPGARRQLRNLRSMLTDLHAADLDAVLTARDSGIDEPVVHLLSFDQDEQGQRTGAAIAFGSVDTAATVHWHVRAHATAGSTHHEITDAARRHAKVLATQQPSATIVWAGHDAAPAPFTPARLLPGWFSRPDRLTTAVSAFVEAHRTGPLRQLELHAPESAAKNAVPHLDSSIVTVHDPSGERDTTARDGSRADEPSHQRPPGLNPRRGKPTRAISRPDVFGETAFSRPDFPAQQDLSAADEPRIGLTSSPAPATMPEHWEPVHDEQDPLFATLARILSYPGTADVRDRIDENLSALVRIEAYHRGENDDARRQGSTTDAQWEQEQRRRYDFDRRMAQARDLMAADPATHLNWSPAEAGEALAVAARGLSMNMVSVSPAGIPSEITMAAGKPAIFVRHTPDGRYEIGVTPEGTLFTRRPGRSARDLSTATGVAIPREQIPPPLDRVLASPQFPLLGGAAMDRKYIDESRPIAVKSTIERTPAMRRSEAAPPLAYYTPVGRMSPEELESHRLFVGPDGRLYRASDGMPFDTGDARSAYVSGSGRAMFVMDEFGNLYAGDQVFGERHHSSFLGGRTVTGAGEIEVRDGRLTVMSDRSGHYLPRPEINDFALDWLRRQGLVLDEQFTRQDFADTPRERSGELDRQRGEVARRQILLESADQALSRRESLADPRDIAAEKLLSIARWDLDRRRVELNYWRNELAAGRVQKTLRDQLFAHPAPAGPTDRLTPPQRPHGFDEAGFSARDRAAWWQDQGRTWWDNLHFEDLAPAYQSGLLTGHPGLRNGEGIPAPVRDALNRKYIQLEIARLGAVAEGALSSGDRRRLRNLKSTLADLYIADLDALLAARRSGTPVSPIYLLSFEQESAGRQGAATIAFGDVDTAATVHWHAPASASIGAMTPAITEAVGVHATMARRQPNHATVVWIAPAREPSRARRLMPRLFRAFSGTRDRAPDRLGAAVSAFADAHRAGPNAATPLRIHLFAAKSSMPHVDSPVITVEGGVPARHDTRTTGDGSKSRIEAGIRTAGHPATEPIASRNDCAPKAIAALKRRTNSPVVTLIDMPVGPNGVTRTQLETHAGAQLRSFNNHTAIAHELERLGPGATALIVDNYTATDENGIGAHAYLLVNDGIVTVDDPGLGVRHNFPPRPQRELSRTRAILYGPDGLPAGPARISADHAAHVTDDEPGIGRDRPFADASARPAEITADDTYFGADLLNKLDTPFGDDQAPERTRFDHPALEPPPLAEHERLDNLTPEDRQRLFAAPGVPVTMPRLTLPGGRDALVLVDDSGRAHSLPASGSIAAKRTNPPNGPPYYTLRHADGRTEDIPASLTDGFLYRADPAGGFGALRWNVPGGQVRFLGREPSGQPSVTRVPPETTLVARAGDSSRTWIKDPDDSWWVSVDAPHSVLPELPVLAARHDTPLFGPDGLPKPHEARQREPGLCFLVAPMKHLADNNPASIAEAMRDHGDGTASVRFMVDGVPEWVLVEKSIYVEPGTDRGYFLDHEPGEPLWAAVIDKAYTARFGRENGYHVYSYGGRGGEVAGLLGKGFHQTGERSIQQPVRSVDIAQPLNPLRFDPDTVHALVAAALPEGHRPDSAFAHRFAGTIEEWSRERDALRDATFDRIGIDHADDPLTRQAAWDEFLAAEDLGSVPGFRKYLNDRYPRQWQAEKDALAGYYSEVYLASAEDRALPDRYRVAGEQFATQIDYALERGDTVTIATDSFSDDRESVPGLPGGHAYAVLGVEYDSATGRPARLLLENPWDQHDDPAEPPDGIEFRLIPARGEFVIDRTDDEGGRYILAADGTEYFQTPDGAQYRHDPIPGPDAPDRPVYGVTPRAVRSFRSPDGTLYRTFPGGYKTRVLPDGTAQGTGEDESFEKLPDGTWSPLANHIDWEDPTVPRRGGLVAVDLAHLPKFESVGMSGPGAHGLHGPAQPDSPADTPAAALQDEPNIGLTRAQQPEEQESHVGDDLPGTLDEETGTFEPKDGDTYLGALGDILGSESGDTTNPERTRYDRTGLEPPTLADHERFENLTPVQVATLLPAVPVSVKAAGPRLANGNAALTLVDTKGGVLQLPGTGHTQADYTVAASGQAFYDMIDLNGQHRWVPTDLVPDFRFQPGTGNAHGTLTWKVSPEIRVLGRIADGRQSVVRMPYGADVVAVPGYGPTRYIKLPGTAAWHAVTVSDKLLAAPPDLVQRHDADLFGPHGPQARDARQGAARDCTLIAPLKAIAQRDPQAIRDMLRDHGDGTVSVRLRVDRALEWVRVEKSIYVYPGTQSGYFAGHNPGEPLWPAMIEKAFAHRLGRGDGFYGIGQDATLAAAGYLGTGFYHPDEGVLPQPIRDIDDRWMLNPLQLDYDSLNELLGDHADPEFLRRFAGSYDHFEQESNTRKRGRWSFLELVHGHDSSAKQAAWDGYLRTEALTSPPGFREYLNERFPGQWSTEKNALANFYDAVYGGETDKRSMPALHRSVAEAVANRFDYALRRGTTVITATHSFGEDRENSAVPGLVGNHAYAVLGIERDPTGKPVGLILENPHDYNGSRPAYPKPVDGIEYRLALGGDGYTTDGNGVRYLRDTDGTTYSIHPDGSQFRRDADGSTYSMAGDGARIYRGPNGLRHFVGPDGSRYWQEPGGDEFWTKADGTQLSKRAASGTWEPDPGRVDPPDMTIPRRGGILAVGLDHLPKFMGVGMSGAGAHGLYGPADAPRGPAAHSDPMVIDKSGAKPGTTVPQDSPGTQPHRRVLPAAYDGTSGTHDTSAATGERAPNHTDFAPADIQLPNSTTTPDRSRPDGAVGVTSDGSTSHPRTGTTPHTTTGAEQHNDCAPKTLAELKRRTGSPVVVTIDAPVGPTGITRDRLETHAGASTQPFADHAAIADELRNLGDGAVALVVDSYTTTDAQGIGAHTYLLVNENGAITVVDRGSGVEHDFPPAPLREMSGTEAILYTAQGIPHNRVQQAYGLAHDPADQGHIGDDGVRRFESDDAGSSFGFHRLSVWHELPHEVRDALHAYEETQVVNFALRRTSTDAELDDWIDELHRTADMVRLAGRPRGVVPRFAALHDRREVLSAKNNRTGDDDEQLRLLEDILADPRPAARWDRMAAAARLDRVLGVHFDLHYDRDFDRDAVRHEIALLDQATDRRLRLTEPIRIVRALKDIDYMATDEHGAPLGDRDPELLLNVVQQDRGYMSTSLGVTVPRLAGGSSYRMELLVPPGARGVLIGSDATNPEQRELLLARDTRYRISRISRDGDITVLHAEVLPPPAVDPARGEPLIGSSSGAVAVTGETHAPAQPFEPEDGDTDFGDALHRMLDTPILDHIAPTPAHRRPNLAHPGLQRPGPLPDAERLENLTAEQVAAKLPVVAVPITVTTRHSDMVTFADHNGGSFYLQPSGRERAILRQPQNGPAYYETVRTYGPTYRIPLELAKDFRFQPDTPGGDTGDLRWSIRPDSRVRILGRDEQRRWVSLQMPYGTTLAAKPGRGSRRWVKYPGVAGWTEIKASHRIVPRLPDLVDRRDSPLFGPSGLPKSQDARQAGLGDCGLVAPFKWLAERDPQAILDMLHDHGDGTVSVRLMVDGAPVWDRHLMTVNVDQDTKSTSFIGHSPGEPLWPSIIEKAFAHRIGRDDGYLGIVGVRAGAAAAHLGKGFHRAGTTGIQQPVHHVDDWNFLNPLGFDMDTVHELVRDYAVRAAPANSRPPVIDPEFARAVADTLREWHVTAEGLRTRRNAELRAAHTDAPAFAAAWNLFLHSEDLYSPTGFRAYLDDNFPDRWKTEKQALTEYFNDSYGAIRGLRPEDLTLTSGSEVAAQAVGNRIGYALDRGTTLVIGTQMFGSVFANRTAVPGLIGNHYYAVLGVERDAKGTPQRLILDNPHDGNGTYPVPARGIHYRLDSREGDYVPHPDGGRYRREANDDGTYTEYGIEANGTRYRVNPDGVRYGINPAGARYRKDPDGAQHHTFPDGSRYWQSPSGNIRFTDKFGNKTTRPANSTMSFPDPFRTDPPDVTIPLRGGIVAVDLQHLPKFSTLAVSGAGAYGLYGADFPTSTTPGGIHATPGVVPRASGTPPSPAHTDPEIPVAMLLGDCGPLALRELIELTGSTTARIPEHPIGPDGLATTDFQDAAGAPLRNFVDHQAVAEELRELGPGATALIVDAYRGPATDHGVGAHAYVLTNDRGVITVRDPGAGIDQPLGAHTPEHVDTVHAAVFTPSGDPHIVAGPDQRPLPATRIGMRTFATRTGAGAAGAARLPVRNIRRRSSLNQPVQNQQTRGTRQQPRPTDRAAAEASRPNSMSEYLSRASSRTATPPPDAETETGSAPDLNHAAVGHELGGTYLRDADPERTAAAIAGLLREKHLSPHPIRTDDTGAMWYDGGDEQPVRVRIDTAPIGTTDVIGFDERAYAPAVTGRVEGPHEIRLRVSQNATPDHIRQGVAAMLAELEGVRNRAGRGNLTSALTEQSRTNDAAGYELGVSDLGRIAAMRVLAHDIAEADRQGDTERSAQLHSDAVGMMIRYGLADHRPPRSMNSGYRPGGRLPIAGWGATNARLRALSGALGAHFEKVRAVTNIAGTGATREHGDRILGIRDKDRRALRTGAHELIKERDAADESLTQVVRAAVEDGTAPVFERLIVGDGWAAVSDYAGLDPDNPEGQLPRVMAIGQDGEPWLRRRHLKMGQVPSELDLPGLPVQPSQFADPDVDYLLSEHFGLAVGSARALHNMPTFRGGVTALAHRPQDATGWPDGANFRVTVDGRDLYTEKLDLTGGPGPSRVPSAAPEHYPPRLVDPDTGYSAHGLGTAHPTFQDPSGAEIATSDVPRTTLTRFGIDRSGNARGPLLADLQGRLTDPRTVDPDSGYLVDSRTGEVSDPTGQPVHPADLPPDVAQRLGHLPGERFVAPRDLRIDYAGQNIADDYQPDDEILVYGGGPSAAWDIEQGAQVPGARVDWYARPMNPARLHSTDEAEISQEFRGSPGHNRRNTEPEFGAYSDKVWDRTNHYLANPISILRTTDGRFQARFDDGSAKLYHRVVMAIGQESTYEGGVAALLNSTTLQPLYGTAGAIDGLRDSSGELRVLGSSSTDPNLIRTADPSGTVGAVIADQSGRQPSDSRGIQAAIRNHATRIYDSNLPLDSFEPAVHDPGARLGSGPRHAAQALTEHGLAVIAAPGGDDEYGIGLVRTDADAPGFAAVFRTADTASARAFGEDIARAVRRAESARIDAVVIHVSDQAVTADRARVVVERIADEIGDATIHIVLPGGTMITWKDSAWA